MKKIISLFSAFALIAILLPTADAAFINDATAVVSANTIGGTITLTSASDAFDDANEITVATIKDLDGSAIGTATTFTYGGANTVDATSVLTIAGEALANHTSYILNFTTAGGDFGAIQIAVGTPTDNTVTVSATVEPSLTFALANTTVDLGILTTGAIANSSTDPTATVATNASSGFNLAIADTDGNIGLRSATASKTIAATANNATVAGSEGFDIQVSETTDPQTNGSIAAGFLTAGGATITGINQTIASSTGPTAGYVSTVNVRAAISGITPAAGDYTTTLTFTATASF